MTDVLNKYLDPAFVWRFTQGPAQVRSYEDALQNGINCTSLAHLALRDIFDHELPSELQFAEMFMSNHHFRRVDDPVEIQRGDLVWFGFEQPSVEPEDFVPEYDGEDLINWDDFPVRHVTVYTGRNDHTGTPLLLHSTRYEGTNVIWPMSKFADYPRYRRLYGVTRLCMSQ